MNELTSIQMRGMTTVGIDIGDKYSYFCELESSGEIGVEGRVRTTAAGLNKQFGGRARLRVAVETGCHSPWICDLLQSLGHEVILANARSLRAVYSNPRKSDRADARMLARLARVEPELLNPVTPRSARVRAHLAILRARACLVEQRTKLVNSVRGLGKSHGHRFAPCSAASFHRQASKNIPSELWEAVEPLMTVVAGVTAKIKEYDRKVAKLCDETYPATERLMQVRGVGPLTALAFVLVIADPLRFKKARDVSAYLGLVPRSDQSGERNPELHITKAGNAMLRTLLVQSSHYILGHFGTPSDLRLFGERLEARGNRCAKKKAVIATARKLSILLLSLWKSGETYEPLRNNPKRPPKKSSFMGKVRIA